MIIKHKKLLQSVLHFIVGCIVVLSISSCATSPGERIGDIGCECIKKSGGDKQRMMECVSNFNKVMNEEMKRQNSIDATRNKDADEAFLMLKKCMDEVMKSDSTHGLMPKPLVPEIK